MTFTHTKLSKQISIESNLFTFNNKLYEKLINHTYNYRFFINQNNYDYTNKLK